LLVDAGNTRIKWGVREGSAWTHTGAVDTPASHTLAAAWTGLGGIARAVASNVAGALVEDELRRACGALGAELALVRSPARQLGVTNGYREPAQLGPDRWAALVAAHHLQPGHKLVVNAGTALTIDALTGDGRFLGGLIVPGPALMRRSLDRGTAGLRLTEGSFEDFPGATRNAITTGALDACAGAIERIAARMAVHGAAPARIVLSGGAAQALAPHLPLPHAIHENLVLEGLALIAGSA